MRQMLIVNKVYVTDLGTPFFPGGPELWHHPLAYSAAAAAAAAAELPGAALQHATLVHPALHPQVPVRSYLWLSSDKSPLDAGAPVHHHVSWWLVTLLMHTLYALMVEISALRRNFNNCFTIIGIFGGLQNICHYA